MIIGLNGYAFSGKDTVGQYLVGTYGFERLSFADKLKDAAAALLNIPRSMVDKMKVDSGYQVHVVDRFTDVVLEPMTFRHFLQRMGTEMGRKTFGEDFWVDQVIPANVSEMWHYGQRYVVTDARFDNELRRIRAVGGYTARVVADEETLRERGWQGTGHPSEEKPDPLLIDYVIYNDDTLEQLYKNIEEVLSEIGSAEAARFGS